MTWTCLYKGKAWIAWQPKTGLKVLLVNLGFGNAGCCWQISLFSGFAAEAAELPETLIASIVEHLDNLEETMRRYFPKTKKLEGWEILNEVDDGEDFKEEFIDLRTDDGAKIKFCSLSLSCFSASQLQTYNAVAMMALKEVLPYTTTHQCEASFSSVVKPNQNIGTEWMWNKTLD